MREKMVNALEQNPDVENEKALKNKIAESLKESGAENPLDEEVINRMVLLEKHSKFNQDSREVAQGTPKVLNYLAEHYGVDYPEFIIPEDRKKEGKIAAILHDIGKSGPATATKEQQQAIIKLFAMENIKDEQLSVEKAVYENIADKEDADKFLIALQDVQIKPTMTMRKFWDLHAMWTHDILELFPQGLSQHTRKIASLHHALRGINPYEKNISDSEIPFEANVIGLLEEYVGVLTLIALDQYQAVIRRKNVKHEEAMRIVRQNLGTNAQKLPIRIILDAIDTLGREKKLF